MRSGYVIDQKMVQKREAINSRGAGFFFHFVTFRILLGTHIWELLILTNQNRAQNFSIDIIPHKLHGINPTQHSRNKET